MGYALSEAAQMTKTQALAIWPDRKTMAQDLGITLTAISHWPDPLTNGLRRQLIGACYELGMMRQYNKVMKAGK